jgi:hypothetical protein
MRSQEKMLIRELEAQLISTICQMFSMHKKKRRTRDKNRSSISRKSRVLSNDLSERNQEIEE